jgi:sensor histidine kinase regulating citrate/malate metabolism
MVLIVASTSALSAKPLIGDRKLAVARSVATTKRIRHSFENATQTSNCAQIALPNMAKFALNRDHSRPIDEAHFNNNQ